MSRLLGAVGGAIGAAEEGWARDRVKLKEEADRAFAEATRQTIREERKADEQSQYDTNERRKLEAMKNPDSSYGLLQQQNNEALKSKNAREDEQSRLDRQNKIDVAKAKPSKASWQKLEVPIAGGEVGQIAVNHATGEISDPMNILHKPTISREEAQQQAEQILSDRDGWGWDSDSKLYAEGGGDKAKARQVLIDQAIKESTPAFKMGLDSNEQSHQSVNHTSTMEGIVSQFDSNKRATSKKSVKERAAEEERQALIRAESQANANKSLNSGGLLPRANGLQRKEVGLNVRSNP